MTSRDGFSRRACALFGGSRRFIAVGCFVVSGLVVNGPVAARSPEPPAATPPAATPPAATPPTTPNSMPPEVAVELQRRIEELEKELEAAKERIRELEKDLAAAQASKAGGSNASAPATPPAEIPADQALASPDTFLRFAQQAYASEFTDASVAAAPNESADAAGVRLQRRIERWTAAMNREWRKSVRWLVQHGKAQIRSDGVTVQVTVLDEATGAPIGEAFEITLDARQAKRYSERVGRAAPPERWVLSAVFAPRFVANPNRMDPGVFNHPPLVGPGVELRQELVVESFVPARQEAAKPAAPNAPTPPNGPTSPNGAGSP
ncbi:MAG: hypothetical protein U0572_11650 [Phycisphaerales bacterium]